MRLSDSYRIHEQARAVERADHAVKQAARLDLPEPRFSAVVHNAQRRRTEAEQVLADTVAAYLRTL